MELPFQNAIPILRVQVHYVILIELCEGAKARQFLETSVLFFIDGHNKE